MRVDVFRFFLLHHFGGVVIDMDYNLYKPFDLLDYKVILPNNRDDLHKEKVFGNCIMASEKDNRFWIFCINEAIGNKRYEKYITNNDMFRFAGPNFMYECYMKYDNKQDIYTPERKLFHPPTPDGYKGDSYGIHRCMCHWMKEKT